MKNERISSLVTTSTCNELKVKLGECNSFVSSIALLFRRSRDAGAAAAAVSPPRPPTAASDQLNLQLVRRIAQKALSRAGEKAADIYGLSYNSTRDELFFADRLKQRSARDASAGRHSTATGRVQRQRTRHVAVAMERVSPERHGHTARVFA